MRWGAITALGVEVLLMGLFLWVLSFFYCFAHSYTHMLAWIAEASGFFYKQLSLTPDDDD